MHMKKQLLKKIAAESREQKVAQWKSAPSKDQRVSITKSDRSRGQNLDFLCIFFSYAHCFDMHIVFMHTFFVMH